MNTNSDFLKLKSIDFWKGLIMAVLSSAFTALVSVIQTATDFKTFNWQMVVLSGVGGFVAYLTKNFFSNSNGEVLKKED